MGRFQRCISTSHDNNTHSAVVICEGEGWRQVGRLDKHCSQGEGWRQVGRLDKHYLSPDSGTLSFGSVFSIGISNID